MPQQIDPLTPSEEAWVREAISLARVMVGSFSPSDGAAPLEPAALDRAYSAWARTSSPEEANNVINAFGAALGQTMIDRFGFIWAIVTDEYGTELAVHGLPGTADILVFPQNLIAKRHERGEIGFIEPLYNALAEQFGNILNDDRPVDMRRGIGKWLKRGRDAAGSTILPCFTSSNDAHGRSTCRRRQA
jgi:hypothetical protein